MGLFESLKDALGILDDAGDYLDRAAKELARVRPLASKLERITDEFTEVIERVRKTGSTEPIEKFDFKRPLIFGKTVGEKIKSAVDDLQSLKSRLRRALPEIRARVGSFVDDTLSQVKKMESKHSDVIKALSELQAKRRSTVRAIVRRLGVASLSVALAGASVAFLYSATQAMIIRAMTARAGAMFIREVAGTAVNQISDAGRQLPSARQDIENQLAEMDE